MVRHLWREIVGFGIVGLIGVICDITTFNVVIGVFHAPKVWGSLFGTTIGTIISYIGNRFWVFRHRELRSSYTEILLYLLVSGVAMGIIAVCVAVNEYVFGFKSLIAANLAQFIFGQGLGSAFRFWAMHVWVFPEAQKPDGVMSTQQAAGTDLPGPVVDQTVDPAADPAVGAAVEAAKTPI
jgi:putative flippase GtrA